MTTTVLGPRPPELDELLARRRELGQDGRDECWGGVYFMAPHATSGHGMLNAEIIVVLSGPARERGLRVITEFNLGTGPQDYTVPDGGVLAAPAGLYVPTAPLVLEVLSPDDATWLKLAHYAAHEVGEILVADETTRSVRAFQLEGAAYRESDRCVLLDLTMADLVAAVDWP